MQVYMLPFGALDSSSGAVDVELPSPGNPTFLGKVAEVGDIVLGIISLTAGPGNLWGPGRDFSGDFASEVTASTANPGNSVLVQSVIMYGGSPANVSGTKLVAIMQRGTSIPATITVGPVDLRT